MPYLKLDDYTVPGYGLSVSIRGPLRDEDISGQTSSTASAKKGNKRKKLDVRLSVKFSQADDLRQLMRVAEAEEGGQGKIYTVTNTTANMAGMRQARFTGEIRADENDSLRKWDVSFTLAEHLSVPELAEARQPQRTTATQNSEGETVGAPVEEEVVEEKLSWFERLLKAANDAIGPGAD